MPLSQFKPEQYDNLLEAKKQRIAEQFKDLGVNEIACFSSPTQHFRMRAEFRLWHQDDDIFYAMFDKDEPKTPIRIDTFPIASNTINRLMPLLIEKIKPVPDLRNRLFQVEFLTTTTDEALITLIYHRPIDDEWEQAAEKLATELGVKIIGRSRKQKRVLSDDFVIENLTVNNQSYRYQQVENSFTQPNAKVNEHMLAWAEDQAKTIGIDKAQNDLLELYCGNGNFTSVLAKHFNQVLATEISKTSVRSAIYNFEMNDVNNVSIARMSSEELTEAMNKVRAFRRMKDIDLDSYNLSTVFVDPPRAGLDKGTEELVTQFEHILYISCNPNTLHENLQTICKTHEIRAFALFDQFPYTDHIECGAFLTKKSGI